MTSTHPRKRPQRRSEIPHGPQQDTGRSRSATPCLRTRLDKGPHFGQDHATAHDLAAAEKDLRSLERHYADTQTEFALPVTLGRTFDQVRNPPPPDATPGTWPTAGAAPRPSRRTPLHTDRPPLRRYAQYLPLTAGQQAPDRAVVRDRGCLRGRAGDRAGRPVSKHFFGHQRTDISQLRCVPS